MAEDSSSIIDDVRRHETVHVVCINYLWTGLHLLRSCAFGHHAYACKAFRARDMGTLLSRRKAKAGERWYY